MNELTIAYVAEGKLYSQQPGTPPKPIDSPFVQTILDRVERSRQRNEWKNQGMAWTFASQARGGLPGMPAAEVRRVRFSGVARGNSNELLYAIETDFVGALFHFDLNDLQERRLFHRQQFRATDLSRHPVDGTLTFAIHAQDGSAHLATMNSEGRGVSEVTEGDAIDEAPSWVAGESKALVFQSAGIGRNQQGIATGLSPYAIQKLDLESKKMDLLVEEDAHDLLLPRMTSDGSLYFIRRPYQPGGQPVSFWKVGLDVVLFPFRTARAIVHFMNFFSMMFSRKPLISAGGPPKEGPDARFLMLWGRMVDADKAIRATKKGEGASLVPSSWQLVRRSANGEETILAKCVLAYDLCDDGNVVYTDGSTIYHRKSDGVVAQIGSGHLIERVAVVNAG